jgi:UDP-glucose 4-epimerase
MKSVPDNFSTAGDPTSTRLLNDRAIPGDITDLDVTRSRDAELVFHQAALASVPRSVADPLATHEACVTGTLHVLMAAREAGVRRVVYAASSSAYGASERLPKRETDPTLPLSPYAVAKLAGEQYCAAFTHVYGLETVRLLFQRLRSAAVARQSLRRRRAAVPEGDAGRKPPTIHGDGQQSRFHLRRGRGAGNCWRPRLPGVAGKVYNVACNRRTSLRSRWTASTHCWASVRPEHGPARPGDVRHSQADITAAQSELGYRPTTDIGEGLKAAWSTFPAPR